MKPYRSLAAALRIALALLVTLGWGWGAQAAAPARHALVIGNGDYRFGPLKNPVNDARAMATSLERLGFRVTRVENASQKTMYEAIRGFGDSLQGDAVGLFYYAGHGVQVKGRNFLIPVDAQIDREDEIAYKAVDVGQLLDKLESAKNPLNMVILDACRNNPFARGSRSSSVGLAQMEAPVGTLVAFATAPGAEASDGNGANGLYTQYLLNYMAEPGLKVEDVFKRVRLAVRQQTGGRQIPWENTSLEGDFYFVPPTVPTSAGAGSDPRVVEVTFWNTIKDSRNPLDYQAYLEKYPNGEFAPLAKGRAMELRQPVQTAAAGGSKATQSRSTSGFSFSAEEEKMEREMNRNRDAAATYRAQCQATRRNAAIRVAIDEQFLQGLAVVAKGKGGNVAGALAARLKQAGFRVAAAGAPYTLSGMVTSQTGFNRVLAINEISLNAAVQLTDGRGQVISSVLSRDESFAGSDLYSVYAELVNQQADNLAAQLFSDFCRER